MSPGCSLVEHAGCVDCTTRFHLSAKLGAKCTQPHQPTPTGCDQVCLLTDFLCVHCCCWCCLLLQERAAALETELRKSKRAEQKLQALLYRLRQDVAEVKQGADLMAKLEDQRSLEYEVDFLTNKVKVVFVLSISSCMFQHSTHNSTSTDALVEQHQQ